MTREHETYIVIEVRDLVDSLDGVWQVHLGQALHLTKWRPGGLVSNTSGGLVGYNNDSAFLGRVGNWNRLFVPPFLAGTT